MECSREFYHFLIYCEDIRAHGGIKPKDWDSNLLNLGPFSAIRSLQFTIRREKERPNESDDAPSTNTRSRTAQVRALDTLGALPNPSPNQADHGRSSATLQDEDMREAQDPSNGSDPMSTDGDSDSAPSKPKTGTKHPKEGSGESGGFTGHIKEFSGESATVPQTSEQVNSEKVIESTFIFLLHTLCLKLGNLDLEWSPDSPQSKVTLGKASIVAAHDGQLKCSKSSAQPEAIVEVKASVLLASHAQKVLMQMGIEMMIWMLKCHTEHQPKKG